MSATKFNPKANSFYFLIFIFILSSCGGNGKDSGNATNSGTNAATQEKTDPELSGSETTSGQRYKRYGFESGYIEMETSNTYMKGKEVIYFTDWGMHESKKTINTVAIGGVKQESTNITIMDGDWTYGYDPKTKRGTKMNMKLLDKIAKKQGTDDLGEIGEEMMKNMGGAKIGTGVVLGKNCDIWEIKNLKAKTWVYKYITLKTEVDQMGMKMVSTAIKFEENPSIPFGTFDIPSDVTFVEISNPIGAGKGKKDGN